MDGIPLDVFLQRWGPTGLLSLVVLLILFGRLIPLYVYRELRAERDEWKNTAKEALKQNTVLLETAHTADATFKAIKAVATQEPGTHESAQ